MKLQGKAVLINADELPDKTKGGLAVPKTSRELLPSTGLVVDHGPECELVYRGCKVHFSRKTSSIINIEGKDFYTTFEERLFYIE